MGLWVGDCPETSGSVAHATELMTACLYSKAALPIREYISAILAQASFPSIPLCQPGAKGYRFTPFILGVEVVTGLA